MEAVGLLADGSEVLGGLVCYCCCYQWHSQQSPLEARGAKQKENQGPRLLDQVVDVIVHATLTWDLLARSRCVHGQSYYCSCSLSLRLKTAIAITYGLLIAKRYQPLKKFKLLQTAQAPMAS